MLAQRKKFDLVFQNLTSFIHSLFPTGLFYRLLHNRWLTRLETKQIELLLRIKQQQWSRNFKLDNYEIEDLG